MSRMPLGRMVAALLAPLLLCATAEAVGRYRLPSNLAQFVGYGNGPGYHAPMVLGIAGSHPKPRVKRVWHSPAPPAMHRYSYGFETAPTVVYTPHPAPAPQAYYAPTPADQPAPRRPGGQPAPTKRSAEPRSPSDKSAAPRPESIPLPR